MNTDFNDKLLEFLDSAPTPYHAVLWMKRQLLDHGFSELVETDTWALSENRRYFVTRNDGSIIAFTYPKTRRDYLMLGAHTDSPNLKIKPNPVIRKEGVVQLGVEPYGGVLINPWFDRDLSIAGKVVVLNDDERMVSHLIDFKKPIAIIPSLAIHLDSKANKERSVNMQNDIAPVLTSQNEDFDFQALLMSQLPTCKRVLSYELSFYDTQKSGYVGLENDFIASARLDNLLSCYVALHSLLHVEQESPVLMLCSDHEEVGSASTSGAAGPFLEQVLRRIEKDEEAYTQMLRRSLLISCDNAHAVHPNFSDKHEPNHKPQMNRGAVIKINANQRYASNAESVSRIVRAADQAGEALQQFVTRSDMGCGSTIGPITATRLGIETVDIGLPTLAMHSIRELAGSKDAYGLFKIVSRLARG